MVVGEEEGRVRMAAHRRDIGRFTNATLIGRGGFGAVYRANDPEHGREVAIKVLQGSLGETERRRFDRERQTMGRLGSHPNIVPVHESGYTEQGEGYIVMSLATKGSVGDRLERDGPLPWPEAVSIIVAISRAAQAAHEQGVLHRDIKPDNILVDAYDNPRLTDFGIAAVASNATATTSTTATIAHAAPEVLHGLPPTPAIDIYALGSTLYNLIIGRPPFQEPDDHGVPAMITRALTQPPPDLRSWGVPDGVADIAARALAKEPGSRQATAAQLADELEAAAQSGPAVAPPQQGVPGAPATVVAAAPVVQPVAPATPPGVPGQQTMVSPVPGPAPSPAAYGHYGAGAAPPGTAGYSAVVPGDGEGGRGGGSSKRLLYLLVGAAVAVLVAAGGVLALSAQSSDEPEGSAQTGTDTGDTDGDSSGSNGDGDQDSSAATPSSAETTSTTASTTATTAATTTSSTTSTTSTTAGQQSDCPQPALDTRTNRFFVKICGDGQGGLTYVGQNRSSGDGITLPACHAGNSVFLATNEGFQYVVDAGEQFLLVTDPSGEEVVFETLIPPAEVDNSVFLDPC